MTIIKQFYGNSSILKPIAEAWRKECNGEVMGIELDMNVYLQDLQKLVDSPNSDLLILEQNGIPIGYIGLTTFKSPLGNQTLANEHYWYVLPDKRGISSIRLLKAAEGWARTKGCSHLLMNASYLASDLCDKVCRIYERLGMNKFECTYLKKI